MDWSRQKIDVETETEVEENLQTREREGRTQRTRCRRGIEGADCGVRDPEFGGDEGDDRVGAERGERGLEDGR